jgi:hypothetical protein
MISTGSLFVAALINQQDPPRQAAAFAVLLRSLAERTRGPCVL